MRTLRRPTVLLVLSTILIPAGCSSTAGLRSGSAPKIRTIASVGDKTLPAEVGESGSSVAADEYTPERRVDKDGRVSGRVFDENGDAVADARVRLALGGASGGKLVTTTTDRSGAFTLHGLRPGVNYTIIAETKDGEQGALRGHSEAHAPDTDVRITLAPDDTSAPPARASREFGKKASHSRRPENGAEDDEQDAPGLTTPGRNELLPPAPEAESFVPPRERATAKANSASDAEAPMTARWRRGDAEQPATRSRANPSSPVPAGPADEAPYDDDGQNPLPPALDQSGAGGSSERTSAKPTPGRAKVARAGTEPAADARVIAPENFTPIALAEKPARIGPPPGLGTSGPPASRSSSAAQAPPSVPWYETPEPGRAPETPRVAHEESALITQTNSTDTEEREAPTPPRRRTWRELASSPPTQQPAPRAVEPQPEAEGNAILAATEATGNRATNTAGAQPDDHATTFCRFDAKTRRLVDFCLPDVSGKAVRLKDLDSDLVLLDFWGTWCKPCVNSIPHLVELQNRIGGKRLTIVGIASEQGTPAARAATVSEAVRRLGINYPVLLSGMDGQGCPVQEALHIQAFPTLILLDREGRVLWRDQGATPATLAKLDNLIAAKPDTGETRRY